MSTDTIPRDALDDDLQTADERRDLALRSPYVPTDLNELAAQGDRAAALLKARIEILAGLRLASFRMTSPEDYVAYKAPEEAGGQIVCYLQDAGCDRIRDLWSIEINRVGKFEKIVGADPAVFTYIIEGDGICKLTHQVVVSMEGGRSSTDDFVRGKTGAELELLVRKAARANLDGNIVRELAGMKSIPFDELRDAWVGTNKRVERMRLGRGFGSRSERLGGRSERGPDVEPPICPHCQSPGQYRPAKGDRAAFYGCPKWESHKDKKFIVNADEWVAKAKAAAPAPNGPTE